MVDSLTSILLVNLPISSNPAKIKKPMGKCTKTGWKRPIKAAQSEEACNRIMV